MALSVPISPNRSYHCKHTDLSTSVVIQSGPILGFLLSNQDVKEAFGIDWKKVLNSSFPTLQYTRDHFDKLGALAFSYRQRDH